jgi:hypothetical protein
MFGTKVIEENEAHIIYTIYFSISHTVFEIIEQVGMNMPELLHYAYILYLVSVLHSESLTLEHNIFVVFILLAVIKKGPKMDSAYLQVRLQ